jgi:hypothetical protein
MSKDGNQLPLQHYPHDTFLCLHVHVATLDLLNCINDTQHSRGSRHCRMIARTLTEAESTHQTVAERCTLCVNLKTHEEN